MSDAPQRILGSILSNLPAMLALKDKRLVYTVANPRFCQFVGRGPAEIVGKTDADLFPAEEAAACAKDDQAVLKSGMARDGEISLTGKTGTRWFDISRSALLDDNGDPGGVMFTAYDVTDFKQREQAVQESEARIAEAQQQAAGLQTALQEQQALAAQSQQEAADRSAALETMIGEKSQLESRLHEVESALTTAQTSMASLQSEAEAQVAAVEAQLEAAQAQASAALEGLRQQLKAAEEERAALEQRSQSVLAQREQAAALARQLVDLLQ